MDVRFSHLGIMTPLGEVSGLCIVYDSEASAINAIESYDNYFSSPEPKRLSVLFSREDEHHYRLLIRVSTGNLEVRTDISGIDAADVARLRRSLSKFRYCPIALAYASNDATSMIPPRDFMLYKQEITIDGEVLRGNSACSLDWNKISKGRRTLH